MKKARKQQHPCSTDKRGAQFPGPKQSPNVRFPSSLFTRFPGSQPVSFLRKHLNLLLSEDYYVCEKSDGLRLLLFFPEPHKYNRAAFLIDRESNVYEIPECLLYNKKDAGAEDAYHVPIHAYF